MKIIKVTTPQQLNEFCFFPNKIYPKGKYPLCYGNPKEIFNPFFNPVLNHLKICCFLAYKEGKAIGRIAAIKDNLNPNPHVGFFGCFEAQNNLELAQNLLEEAKKWLRSENCSTMLGPATFNTNQQVGFLKEGFEIGYQPNMPYNPPYYPELMEKSKMKKLTDLLSFYWSKKDGNSPRLKRIATRIKKNPDLSLRKINLQNPLMEVNFVREVFNSSMINNWGFIPLTKAETASMLFSLSQYSDPDLQLGLSFQGKPAGILLCTPSPLPSLAKYRSTRIAILGISPQYRRKGLDALIINQLIENLSQKGYDEADLSQIHEDNEIMLSQINKLLDREPNRRFRIYQTPL